MKIRFLIIYLLLFVGCNADAPIEQASQVIYYPTDDPYHWEVICSKAPYVSGEKIPEDVLYALGNVYNHSFAFPQAKEVNLLCECEYSSFLVKK